MSLIYTSDNSSNGFDATTLNSLPSGWTAVSGSWAVKNTVANLISAHTHDFEDTSQGASSIDDTALYTGNGAAADMDVAYAQVIPQGGYTAGVGVTSLGCYVRSDSANANGYLFIFGYTGSFSCLLFAKNGGTLTSIATPVALPFTPTAGTVVLTRMVALGSFIGAKIWRSTDAEPTSWTISATDSSVTAAGYAGLRCTQQIPSVQANCSDFNVDSIASSSNLVQLLSPATVAVSGGNIAVSGLYSGTAPTAMDTAVDGGSYAALSGFTASGGNFSGTVTAPANGAHSLDVRDHNNTTHTDSAVYLVTGGSGGGTSIAPNNAAIVYSPYNWLVNGTNAVSVNPGAYFRTLFTGTSCTLNFDVSHMQSPASQIWWRIDNGPWTQATVAATVALTIPAITSGNADTPYHFLEVMFKAMDSSSTSVNRWNTAASGIALKFTGLTLGAAASVQAPSLLAKNILVYGDSITEGIRTLGEADATTTNDNDALMGWALALGKLLGAEVGVVGEGGTGYTASFGGVPSLDTAYNLLFSGQARGFTPQPDLIVINHGTNDGGASGSTIQANAVTVVAGLLAATTTARILVLEPLPSFTGKSTVTAALAAAVSAAASSRVSYVGTSGLFAPAYGSDSLSIHPTGPNNQGLIAPAIAELLRSTLYPATGGTAAGGFVITG